MLPDSEERLNVYMQRFNVTQKSRYPVIMVSIPLVGRSCLRLILLSSTHSNFIVVIKREPRLTIRIKSPKT